MICRIKKQTILFGIMLCALSAQLFCAEKITFSAEQNGISLAVVDCTINPPFYFKQFNTGTPLVPGLGVQEFTEKGMHPIRIIIHNTSAKPVVIAQNSFRMKLADLTRLDQFFSAGDGIALSFFIGVYGGMFGGFLALREGEDPGRWRYLPFSLSNYPVTCSWCTAMIGLSIYGSMSLYQEKLKKIQKLEKYFLNKPIIIEPGKMVQKLVLLDGASFHSFFQFRVFNYDQTEYAATFDIELMA